MFLMICQKCDKILHSIKDAYIYIDTAHKQFDYCKDCFEELLITEEFSEVKV